MGAVVALKTLLHADPSAITRFKAEFRSLADVSHPNLVRLYDLLRDEGCWFLTMELVEGPGFVDHVRAGRLAGSCPEEHRLRSALRQLAAGLDALHRAGKLHCDIKPSNVRVTPEGRVVVLDFGLVQDRRPEPWSDTSGWLAGTPAYMAPERLAGDRASAASDWYSVGVVLFESLTGQLPFHGGLSEVVDAKQQRAAPSPREIVGDLPNDLAELCSALLARRPEARPDGGSVLQRFGDGSIAAAPQPREEEVFVGRWRELAAFEESFDRTLGGESSLVLVRGGSGLGKTALARRFLSGLQRIEPRPLVFSARCYERESLPFKGFDAIMDQVAEHLRRCPGGHLERLLPPSSGALARLFPSLRRLAMVARSERRVLAIPDDREHRRLARVAFRELFHRLATRRTVVLFVDDLQWADRDSAELLVELLRAPDPPPLMFVGTYRDSEERSSPFLQELLRRRALGPDRRLQRLSLAPLTAGESRRLVRRVLGSESGEDQVEALVGDAAGNPFFLVEICRESRSQARPQRSRVSSVEGLIRDRAAGLAGEARRLLALTAVAGQPLELAAAARAGGLSDPSGALRQLRHRSLVRSRLGGRRESIEPYQERIREVVLEDLKPEDLPALHRSLARALEAEGRTDPETLAHHYLQAGEGQRAAELALEAAEEAAAALAFDRAAGLLRAALEHGAFGRERQRQVQVELGDVLSMAGRSSEAADAYLTALAGARPAEGLELRRRVAEQLLRSGRIDEGQDALRQVLDAVGLRLAATPRRAVVSLAVRQLLLWLRGLRFRPREAAQVPADRLLRIDTCWAVAVGLGNVDTIRAMDFGRRQLLAALAAGEPYRIARALAIEAGYSGLGGSRSRRRTEKLLRAAMELAVRSEHPHALALVHLTGGITAFLDGRWSEASSLLARSERLLRERCTAVAWELDTCLAYQLRTLSMRGELAEIRRRLPEVLKDVQERSDLYAEIDLRTRLGWWIHLAADRPDDALAEVDEAMGRWSHRGFHVQHYWALTARMEISLYRRRALEAWRTLIAGWPEVERAQLLRIQFTRAEAWCRRTRIALAAAGEARGPQRADLRRAVMQGLRRMDEERLPWIEGLKDLAEAGQASLDGLGDEALVPLEKAIANLERAGLALYAAVAQRRRGQLLGRERGAAAVVEADRWMRDQGIVQPGRLADVLAPGAWPTV